MDTKTLSNIITGTHEDSITKCAGAVIKPNRLIILDENNPDRVVHAGTDNMPFGVSSDEATVDEIVAIDLLGCSNTIDIVAGADIVAGELLIPGLDGKILPLPIEAGTYTCIGIALSTAPNGEIVEVLTSLPYQHTITGTH